MNFSWKQAGGAWNVMPTPFTEAGNVDWQAFEEMVEFYARANTKGIFVNSQTSEVFKLTDEERFETARCAVELVRGRMGVVSGANFGATLKEQAHSMQSYADLGVDAVIVLVSILPNRQGLGEQILALGRQVYGGMGVYEIPKPEHRLLNTDEVAAMARSGQFLFMKETSRTVPTYLSKWQAAQKSALWVYQANLKCLWDSLEGGGDGFCGVMVNVCPELCSIVCDRSLELQLRRRSFQALLTLNKVTATQLHPAPSKYILQKRGLHLTTKCRMCDDSGFTAAMRSEIDHVLETFNFTSPSPQFDGAYELTISSASVQPGPVKLD
jgi:4-hydroxy-tetrahydrodipicolinate synthase